MYKEGRTSQGAWGKWGDRLYLKYDYILNMCIMIDDFCHVCKSFFLELEMSDWYINTFQLDTWFWSCSWVHSKIYILTELFTHYNVLLRDLRLFFYLVLKTVKMKGFVDFSEKNRFGVLIQIFYIFWFLLVNYIQSNWKHISCNRIHVMDVSV